MAGVNRATILGYLGRDPELRHTQSGEAVCNFSVATNETWTDKSGEKQERVEWHQVVAWGRLAESCAEYLTKGRQVYVEGHLQTREWEDKEGQKRFTTEINALNVQFLGGGQSEERPPAQQQSRQAATRQPAQTQRAGTRAASAPRQAPATSSGRAPWPARGGSR